MESFIELGAALRLDVLDIRTDKGWGSSPGDTSGGKSSEVLTLLTAPHCCCQFPYFGSIYGIYVDQVTPEYMTGVKLLALQRGLAIGYLASIGHFTGTPEENAALVAAAKADVETAVLMGAPLLRCFTSCSGEDYESDDGDVQAREIACFQEICDFAAARGIAVGCQNHPSTGEHMLRIREAVNRPNFTFVLEQVRKQPCRCL